MNATTILLDVQTALNFVRGWLPIIQAAGVATGPAAPIIEGVAMGAELLTVLVNRLAKEGVISQAEQLEMLRQIGSVLRFDGPQWQVSTAPKTPSIVGLGGS